VIALTLVLSVLPGWLAPTAVGAQADELSQREFENLVEDAQDADDPVFGPADGELELEEELVVIDDSDVELANFLVTATFQNPYAGSRQQFDYGVIFRRHQDRFDVKSLAFVVVNDGTWGILDSVDGVVDEGTFNDLDDSRRGENTLTIYAEDEVVHLGINGEYVGSVEVPYADEGGIAVGSGFLIDSFQDGGVTGFTDFAIWDLSGSPIDSETTNPPSEVEGAVYESPTYGYSLTYDDTWDVTTDTSRRGVDTLELDNGISSLQFIGTESNENPTECVDSLIDGLESDDSLTDVTVALDEDDTELRGETADGAFVVLQVTVDTEAGPSELTMFYTCVPIVEDESMLEVTHIAASEDYNDEVENRVAVLDTLDVGGSSTSGRDEPTADASEDALPAGSVTVILQTEAEDGPLVFGTLVPDGDQTEVSLIMLPVGPNDDYEVTVNSGTCRRPGATEFEVGALDQDGYVTEVLDIPVEDLSGGDFIMLITEGGDPDATIACGIIEPIADE
jgi:hypothetical protein